MKVKQIMSMPVDLIDPTTTIADAARKMRDADLGCLLVGTDDRLFGVVTDRDIVVRTLANGRNANDDPVSTVMSSSVFRCFEDESAEKAARIMAKHGVRRLPVFASDERLTGIVSLSDVHGRASTCKPREVTFFKKFWNSRGTLHKVPLGTVYVAGTDNDGQAAAAAWEALDGGACAAPWNGAADGCFVDGGKKKGVRSAAARADTRATRHGRCADGGSGPQSCFAVP